MAWSSTLAEMDRALVRGIIFRHTARGGSRIACFTDSGGVRRWERFAE
jgi:hypothetical protein